MSALNEIFYGQVFLAMFLLNLDYLFFLYSWRI